MLRSKLSLIAAVPFIAGTLAVSQPVQAQDAGDVAAGIVSGLVGTAFLFGGRNYCWYDNGWNGPGWYWCGYAYNDGYGWGGGYGWRGWYWHGGRAPGYRSDGWHGDHHGGGGGDWHGDHHGGGWHGGGPGGPGGHHGGPGGGGGGGGGGHHGGGGGGDGGGHGDHH